MTHGAEKSPDARRPGSRLPDLGHRDNALRGEAQRIKIASELSTLQRSKHTVYISTNRRTACILADVERLLESFNSWSMRSYSAPQSTTSTSQDRDHVIDLGPDGFTRGQGRCRRHSGRDCGVQRLAHGTVSRSASTSGASAAHDSRRCGGAYRAGAPQSGRPGAGQRRASASFVLHGHDGTGTIESVGGICARRICI